MDALNPDFLSLPFCFVVIMGILSFYGNIFRPTKFVQREGGREAHVL